MDKAERNVRVIHSAAKEDQPKFAKHNVISLKNHPVFTEAWLQERIKEDPSIIGLEGEVILRDVERRQPKAGRLDLLLEDVDAGKRYEVELQLGETDESHIIRTIEYWDNERKRYPHYEHCAVIIAEDVSRRFLNVVSLFNGQIPLIAIQVRAVQIEDHVALVFTKVLDELEYGADDSDKEQPETDRSYWETRSSPESVKIVDRLLSAIQDFAPEFELKYNKYYIGLSARGRAMNFAAFKPQKHGIRIELGFRLTQDQVSDLEKHGVEVLAWNPRWKLHPIKINADHIKENIDLLSKYLRLAHQDYF